MVEAVMIWNEPNNKSHWDFEIDPQWNLFGNLVKLSSEAISSENSGVLKYWPEFRQSIRISFST